MAERRDLDAIEKRIRGLSDPIFREFDKATKNLRVEFGYEGHGNDLRALLTYCRELEAERDEDKEELIRDSKRTLENLAWYQDQEVPRLKAQIRELEAENKRLSGDSDEYHYARYVANEPNE